jgi:hypothetical protein
MMLVEEIKKCIYLSPSVLAKDSHSLDNHSDISSYFGGIVS